jgi:hypothetical protein
MTNDRPLRAEGPAVEHFRTGLLHIDVTLRARDGSKHFATAVLACAMSPVEQLGVQLCLSPRLACSASAHVLDRPSECGFILDVDASVECQPKQ